MEGLVEHGRKLGFDSKLNEWVASEELHTKEGYNLIHNKNITLAALGREVIGKGQEVGKQIWINIVGYWTQWNGGDRDKGMHLRYLLEFKLRTYCWMESEGLGKQRIKDNFRISGQNNWIIVTIIFHVGEH